MSRFLLSITPAGVSGKKIFNDNSDNDYIVKQLKL